MNSKAISLKLKILSHLFVVSLFAFSLSAQARIYAVYNGAANGVSVRDNTSFEQRKFFDLPQVVNRIAAGPHRNLYVTSANSIYQYNDRGNLQTTFTFPNEGIVYGSMSVADGNLFVGYGGVENGVSVRDSRTLEQIRFTELPHAVGAVTAGGDNDFYVTVDDEVYRYSDSGEQLNVFKFGDPGLVYGDIAYSNSRIYVTYSGSQQGISVRDAVSLAQQLDFFEPGFTVSGIAAGANDDLYLTSANNIYRYSIDGTELGSFTFPNEGIDYQGIALGSGELSQAFLMTNAASDNVSSLHLINTSIQSQEFFGTIYNRAGEQLGLANTSLGSAIPARGRVVITAAELETIFSTNTWDGPAIVDVTGTADFSAMIKLQSPSGLISNTNCARQGRVDNIEGTDANSRTFIRFINMSDDPITNITGSLVITENGIVRESEAELVATLAAREAVFVNGETISQLFGETWTGTAGMSVSSSNSADLWLLNLNFANEETFFNFSCYENSAE
jgi:sugar lactone lactonase YvrE